MFRDEQEDRQQIMFVDSLGPTYAENQLRVLTSTNILYYVKSSAYTPVGAAINVRKNSGGSVFQRPQLNLIEGSGVTLTVADDGSEVDVTIASAGSLPAATLVGQVLFSVDGANFAAKLPVVDDTMGWLNDGAGVLLVT